MGVWETVLVGGVGAAVAAALIKFMESVVLWIMNRKAKNKDDTKKDKKDFEAEMIQEIKNIKSDVSNLKIGNKAVLRDRIKYLGSVYKKANEISYSEREDLIDMHNAYHVNLDGNGNLDALMEEIMHLPLK